VLASGFAAGIPGMILGIPAYTVLRVFAREFFSVNCCQGKGKEVM
jgi:predicted PurR-regulated permease PerM